MQDKQSFLIYKSFFEPIKHLSDEQLGQIFRAIFEYQIQDKQPTLDANLNMAFMFFKNQFVLDNVKYEKIVERNKVNGSKGGRPKKPKKPNGLLKNPKNPVEPKKPDNDKDKDNEKDKGLNKNKFYTSFNPQIIDDLIAHRKILKKPLLTDRMMSGLLNALKRYSEAWSISFDNAVDFYLSKNWISIDPEYKYTDRVVKNQQSATLTASDINKELRRVKDNLITLKQIGDK